MRVFCKIIEHQQKPVEAVAHSLSKVEWQSPKDFYANPLLTLRYNGLFTSPYHEIWSHMKTNIPIR